MARLIQESGGERRELAISGPITIGRSKTATVWVDDKTLSREHTQIVPESGRIVVRDLNSKNGTLLNGKLLREATVLKHGDRIKVGSAVFVVAFDASQTGPTRPAAAATAATAPTRPATSPTRARRPQEQVVETLGPVIGCVYNAIFVAVVVVGAFVFKGIFSWLLGMLPS